MELRDEFAKSAMAALIASPKVNNEAGQITDFEYATLAYVMADAMLKAREIEKS